MHVVSYHSNGLLSLLIHANIAHHMDKAAEELKQSEHEYIITLDKKCVI